MDTKHVFDRIPTLDIRHTLRARSWLRPAASRFALGLACFVSAWCVGPSPAAAEAGVCMAGYDSDISYPSLAEFVGPDLVSESRVVLYMDLDGAVVELDACLYAADRTVELDFGDLDVMTARLELPISSAGWTVFVTRDGVWTETVETASSEVVVMLWPDELVELELAPPGQPRPIKPLVVLGPGSENPAP